MPNVQVIIVNYNTRDLVLRCLHSLFDQTTQDTMTVTVWDNGSVDGSVAAIAEAFPDVDVIASSENLGFAQANNLAARNDDTPFIFLLNSDTEILDRALERLIDFAQDHESGGIWGPRTVFADGQINTTNCFRDLSVWSLFCSALGLSVILPNSALFNSGDYGGWPRDTDRGVDVVSGCAFLIRRDLWNRLGGFDPAFFMYGEEADLCVRARAIGVQPMMIADAQVIHHMGGSYVDRSDLLVDLLRGKMTLINRHLTGIQRRVARGLLYLTPLSRIAAHGVADLIKPARKQRRLQNWRDVWQRRAEWRDGYGGGP